MQTSRADPQTGRSFDAAAIDLSVFCASNFPLAFRLLVVTRHRRGGRMSGDRDGTPTSGTAELLAGDTRSSKTCGLRRRFQSSFSSGYDIGQGLVRHSAIKAVGSPVRGPAAGR